MKLALGLLAAAFALQAESLAIKNVTAVDANGARRLTVIISGNRITQAWARGAVPKGMKVIDGTGKFLIPGLWDMHVHLWDKQPMFGLYLSAGVIGVRDMGSDPARTHAWRKEIAAGRMLGPRIYTPGPVIDTPESQLTQAPVIKVRNPNEAREAVDKIDDAGEDFIKIMSRLTLDEYQAIAQRARVRRAIFAGHVPEAVSVSEAIDARQKSQEHLFGIALACSFDETRLRERRLEAIRKQDYAELRNIRERTYATFSQSQCLELSRRMARYGVWQCPTLTYRKRASYLDLDKQVNAPELKLVPEEVRTGWKDPREESKDATPEQMANFREDYDVHRRLTSLMHRAGVGMLAGTDTGDAYVVPGFALHDELELLVDAGFSPLEALNTATINAARYFDMEATAGTIARGKTADLVLLDADPLADIRNTRKIAAVVANGHLLTRANLDALASGKSPQAAGVKPAAPATKTIKKPAAKRKPAKRR